MTGLFWWWWERNSSRRRKGTKKTPKTHKPNTCSQITSGESVPSKPLPDPHNVTETTLRARVKKVESSLGFSAGFKRRRFVMFTLRVPRVVHRLVRSVFAHCLLSASPERKHIGNSFLPHLKCYLFPNCKVLPLGRSAPGVALGGANGLRGKVCLNVSVLE